MIQAIAGVQKLAAEETRRRLRGSEVMELQAELARFEKQQAGPLLYPSKRAY